MGHCPSRVQISPSPPTRFIPCSLVPPVWRQTIALNRLGSARLAPTVPFGAHTPTMKKLMTIVRSRGGMVAILGVICVLVGPSISTLAAGSNVAALEVVGVSILLAGYLIIAVGIVMIVVAAQRARSDSGPKKT